MDADATFLSTAPIMFLKTVGTPQTFMTYGICAAFYEPIISAPCAVGDRIKLPSIDNYFTTRPGVIETLAEMTRVSVDSTTQSVPIEFFFQYNNILTISDSTLENWSTISDFRYV